MAADPYSILGLARSASEKDVKSAYRKLAKELHPDHNKDNPKAAERFAQVTHAYDLLSDKDKRAKFDRGEIDADGNPTMPFGGGGGFGGGGFRGGQGGFRHDGGFESGEGPDLSDLFEGLFGGRGGMGGGAGMGGGFGWVAAPEWAAVLVASDARPRRAAPMSPIACRCLSSKRQRGRRSASRCLAAARSS